MLKAERDNAITRLGAQDRLVFRRVVDAMPERLYLVDVNGNVAYHGGAGPHFFDLDEWEQVIQSCAAIPASRR